MNRYIFALIFSLLLTASASAQIQDCLLNIGGKDDAVIIQIFQLNGDQRAKLETWSAELELARKETDARIDKLFDTHPQKNDRDLEALASKYDVIKEEYIALVRSYDQKLITIFNERQYERYRELCAEAMRRPIPRLSRLPED